MDEQAGSSAAPVGEWFRTVVPGSDEQSYSEEQPDSEEQPGADGDVLRPRRMPRPPMDVLAVWALATSLLGFGLVAILLGVLARARISASGRRGSGLATAAIVLGAVGVVLALGAVTLYFAVLAPVLTLP